MSSNVKHTDKLRRNFRSVVIRCGGIYTTKKTKFGIKDVYVVNGIKCIYVWHSSPSCSDIVIYSISNLKRLSKRLGIYDQWSAYSNENTVYMCVGLIGDMM